MIVPYTCIWPLPCFGPFFLGPVDLGPLGLGCNSADSAAAAQIGVGWHLAFSATQELSAGIGAGVRAVAALDGGSLSASAMLVNTTALFHGTFYLLGLPIVIDVAASLRASVYAAGTFSGSVDAGSVALTGSITHGFSFDQRVNNGAIIPISSNSLTFVRTPPSLQLTFGEATLVVQVIPAITLTLYGCVSLLAEFPVRVEVDFGYVALDAVLCDLPMCALPALGRTDGGHSLSVYATWQPVFNLTLLPVRLRALVAEVPVIGNAASVLVPSDFIIFPGTPLMLMPIMARQLIYAACWPAVISWQGSTRRVLATTGGESDGAAVAPLQLMPPQMQQEAGGAGGGATAASGGRSLTSTTCGSGVGNGYWVYPAGTTGPCVTSASGNACGWGLFQPGVATCSSDFGLRCNPGSASSSGRYTSTCAVTDRANLVNCQDPTQVFDDSNSCVFCIAGQYCAGGTTPPAPCSAGQYCQGNVHSVIPCPQYYYCPAGMTSPPIDCPCCSSSGSGSFVSCTPTPSPPISVSPAASFTSSTSVSATPVPTTSAGGTYTNTASTTGSVTVGSSSTQTGTQSPTASISPPPTGTPSGTPPPSHTPPVTSTPPATPSPTRLGSALPACDRSIKPLASFYRGNGIGPSADTAPAGVTPTPVAAARALTTRLSTLITLAGGTGPPPYSPTALFQLSVAAYTALCGVVVCAGASDATVSASVLVGGQGGGGSGLRRVLGAGAASPTAAPYALQFAVAWNVAATVYSSPLASPDASLLSTDDLAAFADATYFAQTSAAAVVSAFTALVTGVAGPDGVLPHFDCGGAPNATLVAALGCHPGNSSSIPFTFLSALQGVGPIVGAPPLPAGAAVSMVLSVPPFSVVLSDAVTFVAASDAAAAANATAVAATGGGSGGTTGGKTLTYGAPGGGTSGSSAAAAASPPTPLIVGAVVGGIGALVLVAFVAVLLVAHRGKQARAAGAAVASTSSVGLPSNKAPVYTVEGGTGDDFKQSNPLRVTSGRVSHDPVVAGSGQLLSVFLTAASPGGASSRTLGSAPQQARAPSGKRPPGLVVAADGCEE